MSRDETGVLHVLTVHFNTPKITARLVKDLPRRTPCGRKVRVHILDNASTAQNKMALWADLDGLDHVALQTSDRNIGFGDGMNLLASKQEIGSCDNVWLLNPDTRLDQGCLQHLEVELDRGSFDVVSPLIYSGAADDKRIWYCGGDVGLHELRVRHRLYGSRLDQAPPFAFETEFITGAAPMMSAATFRAVGGFPHGYFLYWEDTYFSWRARSIGLRLGVVPMARLWHAVGASSGYGQSRTFFYWSTRNRFRFAKDIGVPRRQLVTGKGGLHTLRLVSRAFREPEARLAKARAAARGTLDGLRMNVEIAAMRQRDNADSAVPDIPYGGPAVDKT